MCTVSIVPHRQGVRLVCNRDERRTRLRAVSPRLHCFGTTQALFPLDARGGGTWVGVNSHGLIAALLNRNDEASAACAARTWATTRGVITARALRAGGMDDAMAHALSLTPGEYAPFRLVLIHGREIAVIAAGGSTSPVVQRGALTVPRVFSSSSVGDQLVEPPRRGLLERLLVRFPDRPLTAQAIFHRVRVTSRPELSVVVCRDDVRTVSRTQIDVNQAAGTARLVYDPLEDASQEALAC